MVNPTSFTDATYAWYLIHSTGYISDLPYENPTKDFSPEITAILSTYERLINTHALRLYYFRTTGEGSTWETTHIIFKMESGEEIILPTKQAVEVKSNTLPQ